MIETVQKIVRLMGTRPGCWRGLFGMWLFRGRDLVPGGAACTQGCVRHRVRRENPPVRHLEVEEGCGYAEAFAMGSGCDS